MATHSSEDVAKEDPLLTTGGLQAAAVTMDKITATKHSLKRTILGLTILPKRELRIHVYCYSISRTRNYDQLTSQFMDEWIIKMRHLCSVEYCSATKKNEIMSLV